VFPPTRAAALDALDEFVPRAGRAYARDRNTDSGPGRRSVSGLSPYIRHRLVTEREVVEAVLAHHRLTDAEKFVQEVYWRTYWKGWLEQNPDVWARYRRDVARLVSGAETPGYAAAAAGRTGIAAMDAWVAELVSTGYLHNHTRMWFASIWIFTLGLPWQLGADLFLRHLLDGDPASNTLSWRWVAGLQTAGKTYLATTENIARYTEGRFAPTGLATVAPALSEDPLPPRRAIPAADPPVRGERVGLLLHGDDLDAASVAAEHPWLATPRLAGIAVAADARERSPLPVSPLVRDFETGAVADAAMRARDALERPAVILADASAGTVIEWAARENLDAVVAPVAPVGPTRERLDTLAGALASDGVAFSTVRRRWDELAWPLASRGFFPFRERIPELLRAQGL
jgi:hypothetical protein